MPTESDCQQQSDSAEQPRGRGVPEPEVVDDHGLARIRSHQERRTQTGRSRAPPDMARCPEDRATHQRAQRPQRYVGHRDAEAAQVGGDVVGDDFERRCGGPHQHRGREPRLEGPSDEGCRQPGAGGVDERQPGIVHVRLQERGEHTDGDPQGEGEQYRARARTSRRRGRIRSHDRAHRSLHRPPPCRPVASTRDRPRRLRTPVVPQGWCCTRPPGIGMSHLSARVTCARGPAPYSSVCSHTCA